MTKEGNDDRTGMMTKEGNDDRAGDDNDSLKLLKIL